MLTFCYCKQARPGALFSLSRHQECYADINGSFPRQNSSLGELQFLAKGVDALLQQTALLRPLPVTQLLFLHLPLQTNYLRGVPLLKTTCGIYVLQLGDSGGVVNSFDFCPASLKSLGYFYFWCMLSSQWKAVTVNL